MKHGLPYMIGHSKSEASQVHPGNPAEKDPEVRTESQMVAMLMGAHTLGTQLSPSWSAC